MFSYGFLNMDTLMQANQLRFKYISSGQTLDVVRRTCKKWWMMQRDGKREREIQETLYYQDDDDDESTGCNQKNKFFPTDFCIINVNILSKFLK